MKTERKKMKRYNDKYDRYRRLIRFIDAFLKENEISPKDIQIWENGMIILDTRVFDSELAQYVKNVKL